MNFSLKHFLSFQYLTFLASNSVSVFLAVLTASRSDFSNDKDDSASSARMIMESCSSLSDKTLHSAVARSACKNKLHSYIYL